MPFCQGCGNSLATGAAFCTKCGRPATMPASAALSPQGMPSAMAAGFVPGAPPSLEGAVGSRFIGQWNWGAAMLYPYWLMTHRRVPLGIIWLVIGFIPVLGIATLGGIVYFGINGNKIAVLSGRFSDETTFVAVQNAWKNWAFGILLVTIVLLFVVMALGFLGQKPH